MSFAALATDNTLATRAQRVAAVAAEFSDTVDAEGRCRELQRAAVEVDLGAEFVADPSLGFERAAI